MTQSKSGNSKAKKKATARRSSQAATSFLRPREMIDTLVASVSPFIDKKHGTFRPETVRENFLDALSPFIGHYRVADCVSFLAMIEAAGLATTHLRSEGVTTDEALSGVCRFLKEFSALGLATGPECVSARAYLLVEDLLEHETLERQAANSLSRDVLKRHDSRIANKLSEEEWLWYIDNSEGHAEVGSIVLE